MTISSDTVFSYIPRWLQHRYAQFPEQPPAPLAEYKQAATLLVDIAELTPLVERLVYYDHEEIQQATQLFTYYFETLISTIDEHGGELIDFNGDSMLIAWYLGAMGKDLATLSRRAAHCGLILLNKHNLLIQQANYVQSTWINDYRQIKMRLVINTGLIWTATVGGVQNQWALVIAGNLFQSSEIIQLPSNTLIVAPDIWHLLIAYSKGKVLSNRYIQLQAITYPLKPRTLPPLALTHQAISHLHDYLAPITLWYQQQSDELKEFYYNCTVVYVGIKNLNYRDHTILTQLQDVFYDIQQVINNFNGCFVKFTENQPDITLTIIWGIPSHDSINNALRAMQAAQKIQQTLEQHNLHCNIGISTGEIICHLLKKYGHFAILGTTKQIAILLMKKAKITITCDRTTYQATQAYLNFKPLSRLIFKGQAMETYQLLHSDLPNPMIARRYERNCLIEQVENLQKHQARTTVLIEGETGIGKTCLINDFLNHITALPVTCLVSHADPHQETTPYYIWRSIFTQLFGCELPLEPEARRQQILSHLQSLPSLLLPRLPLLNAILPLNLPENNITMQMHGKVRIDNINALLLALLHEMLKHSHNRYIFIFEDVDWLDSASWTLLRLISQQIKPILLVLTVHPANVPVPQSHQFLFERTGTQLLHLEPLSTTEIAVLLAQRLAVLEIPQELINFITAKTKGHPLFSEQLLYALRDSGLLRIIDRQCYLAAQFRQYTYSDFPETLTEVIFSRFIHLTPILQQLLKVASVIGNKFTTLLLLVLYPIESEKILICLTTLQKLDFIIYHNVTEEYSFKDNLSQKTIYELITLTEKQQLHNQIALWYEKNVTIQLNNYYPIIAYHWSQTENTIKTLEYLTLAGEQALNFCTYQEATYFFQQLLQRDKNNPYFALQLGKAYLGLNKIEESQQFFEQGLKFLNKSLPKTTVTLFISTLWQLSKQILHRLFPRYFLAHQMTQQLKTRRLLQAAYLYEQIGDLSTRTGMSALGIFNVRLYSLNLAESIVPIDVMQRGDSELLTRTYIHLSVLTGLLTFSKIESLYANYALKNIDSVTQLTDMTWIFQILGIRDASYGRWVACQVNFVKAIKIAEHVGDIKGQMQCLHLLNLIHCYQGQFTDKIKQFNVLYVLARQYNDLSAQVWGLCGQIMVYLQLDQLDNAVNCLKIVQSLPSEQLELNEAIWVCGLLAQVYFRQGLLQRAVQMATKTAHLIAKKTPDALQLFESYVNIAHIYLSQWENATFLSKKERYACNKLSKHACQVLDDYADRFQMAKPRSLLLQGLHAWLNGQPKKAHVLWEKSLDKALDLNMLYEQALTHFEIARHAEHLETPKIQQHLQKALEIFTQLNAQYYLQQVIHLTQVESSSYK